MESVYLFWIVVILISLATEVITTQLVSVWFMIGGILALITSFFTPSIPVQVSVFVIISLFMLILARPFIKNILKFKVQGTNSDRLIGKTAKVTKDIDNTAGKGEVNIEGMPWSAKSTDCVLIKSGDYVKIESISGVKLIVHRI